MRKLIGLFGLALIASPAFAQINVDQHDGSTDFTSRGISGVVQGWAFNKYSYETQGSVESLDGWSTVMQDQNCFTIEPFQFAILAGQLDASNAPAIPGDPGTFPDPSQTLIGATGVFGSPGGQPTGACAWIFTSTFFTPVGPQSNDLFTATLLWPNALWTGDGVSSHISIATPSPGAAAREYPNLSANSVAEHSREFGVNWTGGGIASSGVVVGGAPFVPGSARYWINRLRYDHTTRAGATDTAGNYSLDHGALGPDNFGMAGTYIDPLDRSASISGRADELLWRGQDFNQIGVGTGNGQILLGLTTLGPGTGFPTGVGVLNINPTDPLFNFGGTPGLGLSQAITGQDLDYHPAIPLMQSPQGAGALALWWALSNGAPLSLYAQEVRSSLVTNQISLGAMDTHVMHN